MRSLDTPLLSHLYIRKRHFGVSYMTLPLSQSMAAGKGTVTDQKESEDMTCCPFCTNLCLSHSLVQEMICLYFLSFSLST